jgi:hypothetical protein
MRHSAACSHAALLYLIVVLLSLPLVSSFADAPAFTLAYLLRILYAPTRSADAAQALTNVHATLPSMERSGFQSDLVGSLKHYFKLHH